MYHVNNEKRKCQVIEGIELPNQEKIRMLKEKETCTKTTKKAEMKEKI